MELDFLGNLQWRLHALQQGAKTLHIKTLIAQRDSWRLSERRFQHGIPVIVPVRRPGGGANAVTLEV
jgi:hypothetical protein